jgi:hypothetical protein
LRGDIWQHLAGQLADYRRRERFQQFRHWIAGKREGNDGSFAKKKKRDINGSREN